MGDSPVEVWSWLALRFPPDGARPAGAVVPAGPDVIRERAPSAITKAETMNYRTLMPEPGGMFDPKLFGPGTVIDAPAIDPDAPIKPRKTQFARIALPAPIIHPLFVEHARDELAPAITVEAHVIAEAANTIAAASTVAAALEAAGLGALVLRELPMVPPELRPLHRDADDRWMTAGLNLWYQRVINRSKQLARSLETADQPPAVVDAQHAALHEAIRKLFENDESPDAELDHDGKPLPSLRTLCGGTLGLYRALRETPPAGAAVPGRCHVARQVMFGLAFAI